MAQLRGREVSIWHLAILLPWVVAAVSLHNPFSDNSYLWHVRAGDRQVVLGAVLNQDPFSYTMSGEPWRTQSWLAELGYSLLDSWLGLRAAPLLTVTMAGILFVLLGLIAYRNTRSLPSVTTYLVLSALLLAAFLNPRPVIFSFPLFAAVVVADSDRRLRWTLPLLIWIWASVHGSFPIGVVYVGLRTVARPGRVKGLIQVGIIGAAALVTAHGWGVVEILTSFARNQTAVNLMAEWHHPDLLSLPFLPLLLSIFVMIYLSGTGKVKRSDWLILGPFLTLGFSATRAVPPAWIALAPLVSRFQIPIARQTRLPAPLAGGIAGLLLLVPILIPWSDEVDETRFPVHATEALGPGNVFHDDATGGWLIYEEWPERQVYVDDRAELFGDKLKLMADLRGGVKDWDEEFAAYDIQQALLRQDTALAKLLRAHGWDVRFEDEEFVVLSSG